MRAFPRFKSDRVTSHGQHSCSLCPNLRQPQDPSHTLFLRSQMCRSPQAKKSSPQRGNNPRGKFRPHGKITDLRVAALCRKKNGPIIQSGLPVSSMKGRVSSFPWFPGQQPFLFCLPTEGAFISLAELTMSFMGNICSDTQADAAAARTHIPGSTANLTATDFHCCHRVKNTAVTRLPQHRGTPGSHF